MTTSNDVADRVSMATRTRSVPAIRVRRAVRRQFDRFLERARRAGWLTSHGSNHPCRIHCAWRPTRTSCRRFEWLWKVQDVGGGTASRTRPAAWISPGGTNGSAEPPAPTAYTFPEAGYRFAEEMHVPLLVEEVVS